MARADGRNDGCLSAEISRVRVSISLMSESTCSEHVISCVRCNTVTSVNRGRDALCQVTDCARWIDVPDFKARNCDTGANWNLW